MKNLTCKLCDVLVPVVGLCYVDNTVLVSLFCISLVVCGLHLCRLCEKHDVNVAGFFAAVSWLTLACNPVLSGCFAMVAILDGIYSITTYVVKARAK